MKKQRVQVFLLMSALSVSLQAGHHHPDRDGEGKRPHISKLDLNGDQTLSLSEFEKSPKLQTLERAQIKKLFLHLDKNNDQGLSLNELPHAASKDQKTPNHKGFRTLDTNEDQKVSKVEFMAAEPRGAHDSGKRRELLFDKLDQDSDGFLTKEDRPRHSTHYHKPPHHPGKGEQVRPRGLGVNLSQLDKDGDNRVSLFEFQESKRMQGITTEKVTRRFNALDTNNDGELSELDHLPRSGPAK